MKRNYIVGIAGGSGSGKTTLAHRIKEEFGDDAIILCHDSYYHPNRNLTFEERKALNYDHPDSLDTDMMIEQLKELRDGKTVEVPLYSFVEYTRMEETQTLHPAKVIIVEGILLFQNEELSRTMDLRIYVDVDADIRFIRRLVRDVEERGRSIDSVVTQYLATVKPMHEQFVEPSKKNADVIIPSGAHNPVAVQLIIDRVRSAIAEREE